MTTAQTLAGQAAKAPPRSAPRAANDDHVVASVRYLVDRSQRPVAYNPPPGKGSPRREGNYADFPVAIHNARPRAAELSLDREGFVLVGHPEVGGLDLYDEATIKGPYYERLETLVRNATGAEKVVIFDHTIRVADRAVERSLRAPVYIVHNDYTEASGPRRVRDLLPAGEAEARLQRRFIEVNVWRPIRGPVKASPLALADSSTIPAEDFVRCDLVYEDRVGEIYHGVYNPAHRWSYFPDMEREEAVLIKCYDSAKDGRSRFSLHTAFEDPRTPAGAPPRESIEVRMFAFF